MKNYFKNAFSLVLAAGIAVSAFPVYQMVSLTPCLDRLPELFSTERLT